MAPTIYDTPPAARSVPCASGEGSEQEMQQQLVFLGAMTEEQRLCLPDWLVIAPPKTGTGWVYANMREHPQAYVPDIKELKYFSNRFETEDLRSYLAQFRGGVGRVKGEASPSYSILPLRTIRLIRRLIPNLKLIYLMRDPIDRAWSHARHNFRQREANFKGVRGAIDQISEDDWIANLDDEWNRLSGDYLGQLTRWLSVFPKEQVFLGFTEDLAREPRKFLRGILQFLQIDSDFADSSRAVLDPVNVGLSKELPPGVHRHLIDLYGDRTRELVEFLNRRFELTPPAEWQRTLGAANASPESPASRAHRLDWDVDDETLSRLLASDDVLEMDFFGYHIVRRDSGFMAYRTSLGDLNADDLSVDWCIQQAASGNCIFAANPYDLKSMILRELVARSAPPGSDVARLHRIELQADRAARDHAALRSTLGDVQRQMEALRQNGQRVLEQIAPLERGHAELAAHCDELRRSHASLAAQWEPFQESQNRMVQQLERVSAQLEDARGELAEISGRVRALENGRWRRVIRWISAPMVPKGASQPREPRPAQQTVGSILVGRPDPAASKVAVSSPNESC